MDARTDVRMDGRIDDNTLRAHRAEGKNTLNVMRDRPQIN